MKKGNVAALLPIGVFLVLYLGLGILFEYGMGISMGFYNIPIVVIFLVALLVACFQNRSLSFDDKLVVMGRGIGDKTIVTMILIFMAAGVFVGTVGRDSAESVAYLMLSVIPAEYSVAVLVSAICALIRENGGFVALLNGIKRLFRSRKGGQLGMGLLVGAMDIATANNTVAIVMANPIAHEMAETYNVSRRKTASILDTFSCVFQGVIPYGAQMLVAISACTELGFQVSAFQIMPFLFYPFFLLISSLVFIFFVPDDRGYVPDHAAARMEATVGAAEGAAGDK